MALTLTIIFMASGIGAILYTMLALLSMLQHGRTLKGLAGKYQPDAGKPLPDGVQVAEAFWGRAKILLLNERFDAALSDCKRAIEINPLHAEANNFWNHLVPQEPVAIVPATEIIHPAEDASPLEEAVAELPIEPKPEEAEAAATLQVETEIKSAAPAEQPAETAAEEAATEAVLEEAEAAATLQVEAEIESTAPAEQPAETEVEEAAAETVPEEAEAAATLQIEAEIEPTAPPEQPAEIEAEEAAAEAVPEEAEAAATLQVETEIESAAPAEQPAETEAKEVATEAVPEKAEAAATLQVEAEIKSAEPVEPGTSGETEVSLVRKPLADEEDEGPLIPEDRIVSLEPHKESLLEEYDRTALKEFEEGEAGPEDAEWTRYADKKAPKQLKSKIDLNELPAEAVGLKETLKDLQRAETYNLEGENNLSKNFYNNAIKDFSRALDINPKYVDALINRGSAFAELGRFNDALKDFNQALKFEKRDATLFNKRGEVFLQNKMYNEAIKDFAAALVLNPMFSDAYLNRGRAYSEKGMPEEAMNDFKQAVKADSDQSFSFVSPTSPELLINEDESNNLEEAAKFNRLGSGDMQKEKYQDAVENFTQSINLAANEAEGYFNRGRAFLMLDQPDEALADFNEAVLFDPLNAALYYWRAQAWRAKDNQGNMREDLKLSCEMGHDPACLEYRELKSTTN